MTRKASTPEGATRSLFARGFQIYLKIRKVQLAHSKVGQKLVINNNFIIIDLKSLFCYFIPFEKQETLRVKVSGSNALT